MVYVPGVVGHGSASRHVAATVILPSLLQLLKTIPFSLPSALTLAEDSMAAQIQSASRHMGALQDD